MSTFAATLTEIPTSVRQEMRGRSWHPDPRCPSFDDLRLLRLPHRGFDGQVHQGELVVAASAGAQLTWVFERLFEVGFPIERMLRVDTFDGDDDASMAANNSSCFNFRLVEGTQVLSLHAFALAVDLNPVQNPYLIGGKVLPPTAAAYQDRDHRRAGMLVRPSPVIDAFEQIGWEWGGDWASCKDYHHFAARRS